MNQFDLSIISMSYVSFELCLTSVAGIKLSKYKQVT